MAHIKTSGIIGEITGTLGATVFARTRSGLLARQAPSHAPRSSQATIARHARLSEVNVAWSSLSDAERAAWVTAAKTFLTTNPLGLQRNPTARALFFHVNLFAGYPPGLTVTTLQATWPISPPPYIRLRAQAGAKVEWYFPAGLDYVGIRGCLWGSRPYTTNPITHFKRWTLLRIYVDWYVGVWTDITADWQSALGPLTAGEQIALKAQWARTNHLQTQALQATAVVTA
jgi:hypothetical protein